METLSEAVVRFNDAGYTGQYMVRDGALECATCGERTQPEDLVVDDVFRYEGMSDPDDESVLFALSGACAHKGTLVVSYGPDTSAEEAAVLRRLPDRRS